MNALVTVVKDGRERCITEDMVSRFVDAGYQVVQPEPDNGPVMQEDVRRAEVVQLVEVEKDGRVRAVEFDQLKSFIARGYVKVDKEAKGGEQESNDGRPGAEGSADFAGEQGSGAGGQPEGEGPGPGEGSGAHHESPEGGQDLDARIGAVLDGLDHKDDANWTAHGTPRVDVVVEKIGEDVKRADLERVRPGFLRQK